MTKKTFAWRFFDLGESHLALTSLFRRPADIQPATELARAFYPMPPEPPYARQEGGETRPPPGGLAQIDDACSLDGALMAANGALVAESLGEHDAPLPRALRRMRKGGISVRIWPLTSIRRLAGAYIFLRQPGDRDYARWLIEVLPRVAVAAQFCDLSAFQFVVPRQRGAMTAVVRESLRLFGVPPERVVAIGSEPVFFRRLIFPLPVARLSAKSPRAMEVLESLPARYGDAPEAPRRIYVKAGGAVSFFNLLEPLGFVEVEPERMNFSQVAQAFSKAEWIAGAPGAGLANAVFAPRGLRLLALGADENCKIYYRDLVEAKYGRFLSLRWQSTDAAAKIKKFFA
ncbi:glycosyltransferase 61 family protein [Rhodoblastus sp.]|uniref:glycosyltransferase family 61 protein n=1 Tax=Rhodoblastus sp. TaxID=1962975 RepID=UPI00262DB757|nr:glycosyltransferase 61 family protein [Rhodoblastus sp.]